MKTNGTHCELWDRRSKNIFVRSDGVIVYRLGHNWFIKGQNGAPLFDDRFFKTHTRAKRLVDEIYPIEAN